MSVRGFKINLKGGRYTSTISTYFPLIITKENSILLDNNCTFLHVRWGQSHVNASIGNLNFLRQTSAAEQQSQLVSQLIVKA